MLIEAYIAGAVAIALIGALIGMLYTEWTTGTTLRHRLIEERQQTKRWQHLAERWEARAHLHRTIHQLERDILGVDTHNGSRKAPALAVAPADREAKDFYAGRTFERDAKDWAGQVIS